MSLVGRDQLVVYKCISYKIIISKEKITLTCIIHSDKRTAFATRKEKLPLPNKYVYWQLGFVLFN